MYESRFLRALALTIGVETALLWLTVWGWSKVQARRKGKEGQKGQKPQQKPQKEVWPSGTSESQEGLLGKSEPVSVPLLVVCGVVCSAATLPYVWFVFPRYIFDFTLYVFAAKSFAVLAETVILRFMLPFSWPRALMTSLVCNMGSFGLGLLIDFLKP